MLTHSLTHSLTERLLRAARLAVAAGLALASMCAQHAAGVQQLPYSTHDSVSIASPVLDTWADVKSPGDGRIYSVGTTVIRKPGGVVSQFSEKDTPLEETGPLSFTEKQVVILQVADPDNPQHPDGVAWQSYFGGREHVLQTQLQQPSYGRAISVWPAQDASGAPDDLNTRIAICGETYDPRLPRPAAPDRTNWSTAASPAGFIAVYDGAGRLLWSYHFFGENQFASTTITDVSIRVDPVTQRDIVTYCGMSTNGVYVATGGATPWSTIPPVRPFQQAPPFSQGDTHHAIAPTVAVGTWDGLVGRLSAPHDVPLGVVPRIDPTPGSPPVTPFVSMEFHSIVGGGGNDGLFGLTEINAGVFAVVGATRSSVGQRPGWFPMTNRLWGTQSSTQQLVDFGTLPSWHLGVVLVFLDPGQPADLVLLGSSPIGSPFERTTAHDVLWHGDQLYAVGTTDDSALPSVFASQAYEPLAPQPFVATRQGLTDGYVAMCRFDGAVQDGRVTYASYLGTGGHRGGATGIAAWNEHADHLAVVGWVERTQPARARIVIDSLFREGDALSRVRHLEIQHESPNPSIDPAFAEREDRPGALEASFFTALQHFPAWLPNPDLGPACGGGVAVDPRGLISVVGSSTPLIHNEPEYPIRGPAAQIRRHRTRLRLDYDAIRSMVCMLPDNVCRTDGIWCPTLGWSRSAGSDGGTTPRCALERFGNTLATPSLRRIFIDFEGQPAPGYPAAILIDRPPAGMWSGGVLQIGFPNALPIVTTAFPGVELWLNGQANYLLPAFQTNGSYREPLWGPGGLPAGSHQFSVQFVSVLAQPLCQNGSFVWAASPALMVGY
jgi:hypothetical protein